MSSLPVRNAFRNKLQADFPGVEYVETIAKEPPDYEVLSNLWMTTEFATEGSWRTSIGTPSHWQEDGTCYVSVVGKSGAGDSAVMTQADLVATAFRGWQYPSLGIRVVSVTAQSITNADSDGRWWFVAVQVSYERNFYA